MCMFVCVCECVFDLCNAVVFTGLVLTGCAVSWLLQYSNREQGEGSVVVWTTQWQFAPHLYFCRIPHNPFPLHLMFIIVSTPKSILWLVCFFPQMICCLFKSLWISSEACMCIGCSENQPFLLFLPPHPPCFFFFFFFPPVSESNYVKGKPG